MREIKLRAKTRDLAHEQFPEIHQQRKMDFVYGTGVYQDTHNTWLILENQDKKTYSEMCATIVDPETVDQYTGLKDMSGKEIYEGDIINDTYGNKKGNIEYNVHIASFEITDYDGIHLLSSGNGEKFFEVIGNIHDNLELLK